MRKPELDLLSEKGLSIVQKRQRVMKQLKSVKSTKILFLLLAVFVTVTITEGPYDFRYDLYKVVAIGNAVHFSTNNFAENGPRIKHNGLGIVFKHQYFFVNPLISNNSSSCMGSWYPKDFQLTTKSDRAPPEKIFS
jgi:hypothetical protein